MTVMIGDQPQTQGYHSTVASADSPVLLRVEGIVKQFPGTLALDNVSLDVRSGEIVAVIGHNGSGKSTLVKILAGIYQRDAGAVELFSDGEHTTELHFIHQDLGLVHELSTIENLNLARRGGTAGFAPHRKQAEIERAQELIARFGADFDVTAPVGRLSPAQRAIVAIARALDGWTHRQNVLILDEPTEALAKGEVEVLFDAVRRLTAEGVGIIFISHRLDEVLELADTVVVLRDGVKVGDEPAAGLDTSDLVEMVTGATAGIDAHAARGVSARRDSAVPALAVRGLRGMALDDLDLDVFPGEVVGIAGVLGSGREEFASIVFGASPGDVERLEVSGTSMRRREPSTAIAHGMAYVPGDRARYGSVRALTGRENLVLPRHHAHPVTGAINLRAERAEADEQFAEYDVKPARPNQTFALFSGGNQQKIVLAKWLRNKPAVLLLDEPTQGVDIGAKAAIYDAIDTASQAGTAVIVCSSDAKELVRLCDRVIVLRDGRASAELAGDDLNEHQLVLEGYGLSGDARPHGTIEKEDQ